MSDPNPDAEALERDGPGDRDAASASVCGLHHVRVPVSDVLASRDWYMEVLGFEPMLDYEEEDRVVGVALEHPAGLTLGLHLAPGRVGALKGFAVVALAVPGRDDLEQWAARLDALGVEHSGLEAGHLGWSLDVPDPDGILVQLHTAGEPTADDA